MENKKRYWFVVFNYVTPRGSGNGNLGIGTKSFNRTDVLKECYLQALEALPNTIVITNFIEMTEEDYNEFWQNQKE